MIISSTEEAVYVRSSEAVWFVNVFGSAVNSNDLYYRVYGRTGENGN